MASLTIGRLFLSISWRPELRAIGVSAALGRSRIDASISGPDMDVGAWLDLAGMGAGEEPIGVRLHAALFHVLASLGGPHAETLAAHLSPRRRTITGAGARVVQLHDEVDVVLSAAWAADLWMPTRRYVAGTLRDLLLGPSTVTGVRTTQEEHHLRLADGTFLVRFEARSVEMARPRAPWLSRTTTTISATILEGPITVQGAIPLAATSIAEAIGEMMGVVSALRLAVELGHTSDRAHNA